MKTTNSKARQFVQSQIPFKANNLKGVREGECYIVYSYNWYPLFIYSYITHLWYENTDRYSVSTSKHKSQSNPLVFTIKMTKEELYFVQNLTRKENEQFLKSLTKDIA